jgi:hypothetical protein
MVRRSRRVAADVADDQPGMRFAQRLAADAETVGGARRQVLHEDVGLGDHRAHEFEILRLLQVDAAGLLAPVDPHEIARLTERIVVVAAGEVAVRAFELDDPRAGVGQPRGRKRRGHGLLQCDDGRSLQRAVHGLSLFFIV